MAEPGVREIQLSRKQLVFLFMASVVAVVVVFLLGVSVGRGARSAAPPPLPPDAAQTTEAPAQAPPGTQANAASLTYSDLSKAGDAAKSGGSPAPVQQLPPPPAAAATSLPPAQSIQTAPPPPRTPPAPVKSASPAPIKSTPPASSTKTTPSSSSKAAAVPPGSWFVQVESFRSKDLADNLVTKLRAKGYDVYVVDSPKPLLRVRVGPYKEKTGADEAAGKLKKDGFTSAFVSH
jgi:cell division septation protein DedD